MARPPAVQWYYKQWLGDNKVLAMGWEARAMHFHLLMMSIQEQPPGSIPNDMDVIRRWLSLPTGSVDADQTWRRVKPQIFTAWSFRDNRWFNSGMEESLTRSERYKKRYENGTKSTGDSIKTEEEVVFSNSLNQEPKPSEIDEATSFLFLELGLGGIQNRIKCEHAIKAFSHLRKVTAVEAAQRLLDSWKRYEAVPGKYKTGKVGFLEKGAWENEDSWTTKNSELSMGGW
jgi:hypothetical protein